MGELSPRQQLLDLLLLSSTGKPSASSSHAATTPTTHPSLLPQASPATGRDNLQNSLESLRALLSPNGHNKLSASHNAEQGLFGPALASHTASASAAASAQTLGLAHPPQDEITLSNDVSTDQNYLLSMLNLGRRPVHTSPPPTAAIELSSNMLSNEAATDTVDCGTLGGSSRSSIHEEDADVHHPLCPSEVASRAKRKDDGGSLGSSSSRKSTEHYRSEERSTVYAGTAHAMGWAPGMPNDARDNPQSEKMGRVAASINDEPSRRLALDASIASSHRQEEHIQDKIPISRFSSAARFSKGRQIAVNGLIAYSTRAGRVRVIDPQTGSRLIKKLHSGLANDIDISPELQVGNERFRRLASCTASQVSVWQIPSTFSGNYVSDSIVLSVEQLAPFETIRFHPTNADLLLCTKGTGLGPFLLDLASGTGVYSGEAAESLLRKSMLPMFPSDVQHCACFTSDGQAVAALSTNSELCIVAYGQAKSYHASLNACGTDLAPSGIAFLSPFGRSDSAILVTRGEGQMLDICDYGNPSKVLQRIEFGEAGHAELLSAPASFSQFAISARHNVLLVSTSLRGSVYVIPFSTPPNIQAQRSDSIVSRLERDASSRSDAPGTLQFTGAFCEITTPHQVLQIVYSEIAGNASLFYLHPEGFEQIVLAPSAFHASTRPMSTTPDVFTPLVNAALDAAGMHNSFGGANNTYADKLSFGNAQDGHPVPNASADSGAEHQLEQERSLETDPTENRGTAGVQMQFQEADRKSDGNPKDPLGAQSAFISESFERFYALQQQRFDELQTTVRATAVQGHLTLTDVHSMVYQSIERALPDMLQATMNNSLQAMVKAMKHHQRLKTSQGNDILDQAETRKLDRSRDDLLLDITTEAHEVLQDLSCKAASEVCRKVLDHLDPILLNHQKAVTGLQHTLDVEQRQREEQASSHEAELRLIRQDVRSLTEAVQSLSLQSYSSVTHHNPVHAAGLMLPASQIGSSSSRHEPEMGHAVFVGQSISSKEARPTTPPQEYEDIFLHALQHSADPLEILVDKAPLHRIDRVLPYDGQPALSAPSLLTLCMSLAKDLDKTSDSLEANNGRRRLDWLVASVRSTKWVRGDPAHAAYLPRVYTQVMHSLSERRTRLASEQERALLSDVLQMAEETALDL